MGDLSKLLERFKLPGIDAKALMDWQRQDLEALAQAHREAFSGIQALIARRNEILKETLAQWQQAAKEGVGADALSKQSEAAKRGVQQAIENFRELSDMEAQTRAKAWKVVQERMQENMGNLQKLLVPKK
jgi:phasin family protein